jgi:hypothetical protein
MLFFQLKKLRLSWTSADLIATSEGAYPTGDKFYQEVSPLLCEVWLTLDTKHKKYFTFGEAATEEAFWEELLEDHQSGDLWGYEEFCAASTARNRSLCVFQSNLHSLVRLSQMPVNSKISPPPSKEQQCN